MWYSTQSQKCRIVSGNHMHCFLCNEFAVCNHKADIDRRLRPWCCHLGSNFERPKTSAVHPLACNWYYCAQFIAKPKAACALRFIWAATSSK